jgi:hypothetical protein
MVWSIKSIAQDSVFHGLLCRVLIKIALCTIVGQLASGILLKFSAYVVKLFNVIGLSSSKFRYDRGLKILLSYFSQYFPYYPLNPYYKLKCVKLIFTYSVCAKIASWIVSIQWNTATMIHVNSSAVQLKINICIVSKQSSNSFKMK